MLLCNKGSSKNVEGVDVNGRHDLGIAEDWMEILKIFLYGHPDIPVSWEVPQMNLEHVVVLLQVDMFWKHRQLTLWSG